MANSRAVEAAARARHGRVLMENWADVGGERRVRLLEEARLDLQEAEPIIRQAEQERIREALSQPIHDLASTIGRARVLASGRPGLETELDDAADAMGRLRNAPLAALDSEQVEGEAGKPNVLTTEEATALVSAAFGEDHDGKTLDAVVKRLGDWVDQEVGALHEGGEAGG